MSSHLAVAHIYAVDQGLNLQDETVDLMSYDDASGLLLVVKGAIVFAYDLAVPLPASGLSPGGAHDQLRFMHPLTDGPRVQAVRCSLDGKTLSLKRTPTMIEFVDVASGNVFVAGSDKGRHEILGWFFTEAPGADVVVVTRGGLELNAFVTRRQGLRLQETFRCATGWYRHTHETRMVMVGNGPSIQAWQFVSGGIVSLPPFSVNGALAVPPAFPSSASSLGAPTTTAEHVRLLKVYGRVYCAHINTRASLLELYRFYTDTVVLQHSYELFSPDIQLNVVDNVVVVHHTDSAVTVLIDVAAETAHPIANPLPLALLGPKGSPARGVRHCSSRLAMESWQFMVPNIILDHTHQAVFRLHVDLKAVTESSSDPVTLVGFLQRRRSPGSASDATAAPPSPSALTAAAASAGLASASSSSATAAPPSSADAAAAAMVAAVAGDAGAMPPAAVPAAAAVASPASPPASGSRALAAAPLASEVASPHDLLLGVVRTALQERLPMLVLRKIFDDLLAAYSQSEHLRGGRAAYPAGGVLAPQVVTPEELSTHVFLWLRAQGLEQGGPDLPFLQAALAEFSSSACSAGLLVPAPLLSLGVELMLQQGQEHQVVQLLSLQPPSLPPDMAELVEGLADQPATAPRMAAAASHLALGLRAGSIIAIAARDQSGQIEMAEAERLVRAQLRCGRVLGAARLVKELNVTTVRPIELLQAAAGTGQVAVLAAVYRLYRDALMPTYAKFEAARGALLPAVAVN